MDNAHAAVKVHAVDTNGRVVLDAQIDVLGDTETEVAGLGEIALAELVLLDLEAALQDFLCLGAADGNVDGNLLVTTDTKGTDGVSGLAYISSMSAFNLLPSVSPTLSRFHVVGGGTYCRLAFDRSAAQAPWQHG